jgi:GWxTD domain-containing protein
MVETYLTPKKEYVAHSADNKPLFVSYYKTVFQPANPPFLEKEGRAERFLFHDSIFQLKNGTRFTLKKEGLYLFQQDTTAADGFSYRIMNENFPKFTKIQDLIPPLLLITTPEEYTELNNANGEKPKFDKVILDITDDKDRARRFMRSFYRRVELSNLYFTSFKEGWKNDRGMIYLIFGIPDEVSKNSGNEIWTYKSPNVRFTFVKSGSVYDADNYVLLRDKRFTEPWYATVDQWRKSRFD